MQLTAPFPACSIWGTDRSTEAQAGLIKQTICHTHRGFDAMVQVPHAVCMQRKEDYSCAELHSSVFVFNSKNVSHESSDCVHRKADFSFTEFKLSACVQETG